MTEASYRRLNTQALELPSAGEELSMLILLPKPALERSPVEKNLTFEKFIAWTTPYRMISTEVQVFLPRFQLEEGYDMAPVLHCLGIVDAFQQDKADFSAMSAEKELFVSQVVHKSFVEVNEEGTEGAAAIDMDAEEWEADEVTRLCADCPFLFFIRHNKGNCVLFYGRFFSP
ncbi:serpin B9-like [Molossus molossus]|uniref:serpin B9-like n=1 Tax=Molossus molossus TaxID=27622 RepID=UPI0017471048|nr:serpin B9-like [Molossus molossus]